MEVALRNKVKILVHTIYLHLQILCLMDTHWGQCLKFKELNNFIFKGFQIQQELKIAKKIRKKDHQHQLVHHQAKKEAKKVKYELFQI